MCARGAAVDAARGGLREQGEAWCADKSFGHDNTAGEALSIAVVISKISDAAAYRFSDLSLCSQTTIDPGGVR